MRALLFVLLTFLFSGCDYLDSHTATQSAPKTVWIGDGKDGETLVACKGEIHITSKDAGYQIEFTDADGLTHALYGVKRFSLIDVPQQIRSTLPYPEPNLYDFTNKEDSLPTYSNGETVHPGNVVVWESGAQAKLVIERDKKGEETKRRWERTWIHNPVCDPTAL